MAEKVPPRKRLRFRLAPNPSAGSSAGGGGGGGDGAAAPASAPRREPTSSPPRSPSPPKAFTYNPGDGEGSSGGGGGKGGDGAAAPASAPRREPTSRPSSRAKKRMKGGIKKPMPLLELSPNVCHVNNWGFLAKCLSRSGNWEQLLDGKRTYLRPPNKNRVAKDNDDSIFVTPKPPELAVTSQVSLLSLVNYGAAGMSTMYKKYKILNEHYVRFRAMRGDGSQFYRAFLFSYLENLGKMQGSQAEATRLMECVERSRVNFRRLKWNNAYFSNPEAFFSSVVSEFKDLVNSVANGLNADELYAISQKEISSSRILSLLRLLTEVHIRTHEAVYNKLFSPKNALSFCIESARPFGAGIENLQIRALSQALGIPVHIAVVDSSAMEDGTVQVLCLDFVPQSESGVCRTSGSLSSTRKYYLSSATDKHPVLPAGNLFSSDRMPLVTIVMTVAQATAILYRK